MRISYKRYKKQIDYALTMMAECEKFVEILHSLPPEAANRWDIMTETLNLKNIIDDKLQNITNIEHPETLSKEFILRIHLMFSTSNRPVSIYVITYDRVANLELFKQEFELPEDLHKLATKCVLKHLKNLESIYNEFNDTLRKVQAMILEYV